MNAAPTSSLSTSTTTQPIATSTIISATSTIFAGGTPGTPTILPSGANLDARGEDATLKAQLAMNGEMPARAEAFVRNLSLWSRGNDVKDLQLFLVNKHGGRATERLARNVATTTSGSLTYEALVEYQKVLASV